MAAVCEICDKRPSFGMNLSHSHRRTKRRWNPNIQRIRVATPQVTKPVASRRPA
jgi:large subunit ribosomal protein L28